jgi:NADH:ubiquinone oxidoreductase subunit 5 (subunit L)/multisubunit Na+/H+ antiporter MnhA subunit
VPELPADLLLAIAVAAPGVGGVLSLLRTGRSGRTATVTTAVALLAAAVVIVLAGADRPVSWSWDGRLLVEADRLGALLLAFVLAATLVVQAYAVRSLRGDLSRHRFFLASGLAASATAVVVVAADLWVLVAAWAIVSLATAVLLRHDGRPTARAAGRRAWVTFIAGDAALVVAAVVASATVGTVTLRPDEMTDLVASGDRAGPIGLVTLMAFAAVVAAMTRSALPPAQSWLPMSVAAPTPSSALLHAGIVNGGGVLLIRFAPVLGVSLTATALAVASGCAGVLVGGAVARTRADVKTGLAWSTVAQMGFMVVQCVTGLLGPALVHMVAHGMYKANLFLGSGSTLPHTHPARVDAGFHPWRVAQTFVVTAVSVGSAWVLVRPSSFVGAAGLVFAGFVAATVAQATWAWLRVRPERSAVDAAAFAGLVVATTAAVALAAAAKAWLGPSLPEVDPSLATAGAVALAVTGLAAVGLTLIARHGRGPVAALAERCYLWALHVGDPGRLAPVTSRIEIEVRS